MDETVELNSIDNLIEGSSKMADGLKGEIPEESVSLIEKVN
jgi:hypothetical protein